MSFLKKHIDRLKSVKQNLEREAAKAVRDNSQEIVDMLQDQLSMGLMSDGMPAPEYESYTRKIAYEERQMTGLPETPKYGPYDFKWYGWFFDSMRVRIQGTDYEITADPESIHNLRTNPKIGSREFMKLTPTNERRLIGEEIIPEMYDDIFDTLGRITK